MQRGTAGLGLYLLIWGIPAISCSWSREQSQGVKVRRYVGPGPGSQKLPAGYPPAQSAKHIFFSSGEKHYKCFAKGKSRNICGKRLLRVESFLLLGVSWHLWEVGRVVIYSGSSEKQTPRWKEKCKGFMKANICERKWEGSWEGWESCQTMM